VGLLKSLRFGNVRLIVVLDLESGANGPWGAHLMFGEVGYIASWDIWSGRGDWGLKPWIHVPSRLHDTLSYAVHMRRRVLWVAGPLDLHASHHRP
jgi:hypothetical protein